jgi:hypothetical protein
MSGYRVVYIVPIVRVEKTIIAAEARVVATPPRTLYGFIFLERFYDK